MKEELKVLLDAIHDLVKLIANTPEASPEMVAAADLVKIKADTVERLLA